MHASVIVGSLAHEDMMQLFCSHLFGSICKLIILRENNDTNFVQQGVVVNEAFDKLHEHLNTERSNIGRLHVLHGGVLFRNKHIIFMDEDDPENEFECDPLTKLRRHANKAKYRLIDVFRQFDTDHNWSLSKDELIKGGQATGIEMTEKEVEQMIKNLDTDGDGEIDYDELMMGENELKKKQRRMKALKDAYDAKTKEGGHEVEISLGTRDEFG
ncbi:hypothetical protein LSAT2_018586 [Lamellibrachia satsuma]|nr:hypothetical protein LSAT2_018586 [Lamellibrachia satsuma]